MSVLKDLHVAGNLSQVGVVKKALAYAFWTQWYPEHENDVITKLWFIKTVRVKDVKFVFILIFGPPS